MSKMLKIVLLGVFAVGVFSACATVNENEIKNRTITLDKIPVRFELPAEYTIFQREGFEGAYATMISFGKNVSDGYLKYAPLQMEFTSGAYDQRLERWMEPSKYVELAFDEEKKNSAEYVQLFGNKAVRYMNDVDGSFVIVGYLRAEQLPDFDMEYFVKITSSTYGSGAEADEKLFETVVGSLEIVGEDTAVDPSLNEETVPPVEEVAATSSENQDIELIRKYYNFSYKEYESSYSLKYEPTMSFDEFKKMYSDVIIADLADIKKVGEHRYQFMVDLVYNDGKNERFDVTMEVIAGKLKTISTKQVASVMVDTEAKFDDNLKAYAKWDDGKRSLQIVKDGKEVTADSISEKTNAEFAYSHPRFIDLSFSESGKYLMYSVTGWEGSTLKVYDVGAGKIVHEVGTAGGYLVITDDEKHLYECEGSGFSGGFIYVYSLPGFALEANLYKDYSADYQVGGECKYDAATGTLKYNLIKLNGDPLKEETVWKEYKFKD